MLSPPRPPHLLRRQRKCSVSGISTSGALIVLACAFLAVVGDHAEGHARRMADALGEAGYAWQERRDLA